MTQIDSGWGAINGARLFYRSAGHGPPLLLLHAGICDGRMWDDQIGAFASTHRVVVPDFRGFGQTEMVAGPFAHHHDLRALMDHLGIDRAILVGGSMSGKTTLDFALDYPGRVEALVLVASALSGYRFTDAGTRAAWAASDTALEAGRHDEAAEIEMQTWLAGPRRKLEQIDPGLRQRVRDMLIRSYATPPDLGEERPLEPPAVGRLGEIHVPALIIVGDEDQPDISAVAGLLEAGIVGARKVVMRGTAHLPNMEQPAVFNDIVRSFLATLERSRG